VSVLEKVMIMQNVSLDICMRHFFKGIKNILRAFVAKINATASTKLGRHILKVYPNCQCLKIRVP
jgi:hypothetical protein